MAGINWKSIGLFATVLGAGLSILGSIADEKKMEETIEDRVNKAIAKREKEES